MRKPRDYKQEYQVRIKRGLASGKSRAASRGHPGATDLARPSSPKIDRESPLEKALARIRHGASQTAAAKAEKVSAERLRAHQKLNTTSKRVGRTWEISDLRPQDFWMATRGELRSVTLANELGSEVSAHWNAIDKFLNSNRRGYLEPFKNRGVRDIHGRFHPFETDPNTLRRLDSVGALNFLEIYADVAR